MADLLENVGSRTRPPARRWLAAVSGFVFMICATVPGLAEPVFPPGSSWGIEPPSGFALQAGTGAFAHPSGALLIILNLAQPLDRSRFGKRVGSIEGRGDNAMRIESVSDVMVAGKPSFLVTARALNGSTLEQTLAVQGETAAAIVSTTPSSAIAMLDMHAIRAALLSARERPLDTAARLAALPVKVSDVAGMRVSSTIANMGVKLTDGPGNLAATASDQAFVTLMAVPVVPGTDQDPGRDERHFAKYLEENFGTTKVLATRRRTIGPASVIEATFEKRYDGRARAGLAWTRTLGRIHILLAMEAPEGQRPDAARLERIWAGIAAK